MNKQTTVDDVRQNLTNLLEAGASTIKNPLGGYTLKDTEDVHPIIGGVYARVDPQKVVVRVVTQVDINPYTGGVCARDSAHDYVLDSGSIGSDYFFVGFVGSKEVAAFMKEASRLTAAKAALRKRDKASRAA